MKDNNKSHINYKEHWNKVYSSNDMTDLGWYEEIPKPSLDFISECGLDKNAVILDVGSGATTLIDSLIQQGYRNIIATDISTIALERSKTRLSKENSAFVKWIVDDITNTQNLENTLIVDLWHDRTVLHFLTEKEQQAGYLATLKQVVKKGGYVIIAVFSLEGAKKCSGLDVVNYDQKMISEFLGNDFELIKYLDHLYINPSGGERPYVYTLFRRESI
ncbi:MAG: class I SAM-dependent methyltransferase [Ignavibacteriae bacterium]|nr:class I SAM-dependent methyltransferase [Ignavibacteriota bacterium]NOG99768.1 class I SAM-dependent methyltransferase [Ignavibacteriota bacterium]